EIGDEVAQLAIRVHELVDRAGTRAVTQREVEAGEDQRPPFIDRRRIAEILAVEPIDVLGVGTRDLVEGQHIFSVHPQTTRKTSPSADLPFTRTAGSACSVTASSRRRAVVALTRMSAPTSFVRL